MDAAYLSAVAALSGSAIGALASFLTTWITQRHQSIEQRRANERARRERLFGEFIDQASKLYVDALMNSLNDATKLIELYAILSKLRLFASDDTIAAANATVDRIMDTYRSPNLELAQGIHVDKRDMDILSSFTETARSELRD